MEYEMGEQAQRPRRFIDRAIPWGLVSLAVTIILGTMANVAIGAWWTSAKASTIDQVVQRVAAREAHDEVVDRDMVELKTGVAVLNERTKDGLETSHRIENILKSSRK